MDTPTYLALAGAVAVWGGCTQGPPPRPAMEAAAEPDAEVEVEPMLPAAGLIEHENASIQPYCALVLVAPGVAVTAESCARRDHHSWFVAHFSSGEKRDVSRVVVEEDSEHPLAALILDADVDRMDPVDLASEPASCDLRVAAPRHAPTIDKVESEMWTGCVAGSGDGWFDVHPTAGDPSCHGDSGAGAFMPSPDPRLAGVTVAVDGSVPGTRAGCVGSFRMADAGRVRALLDSLEF